MGNHYIISISAICNPGNGNKTVRWNRMIVAFSNVIHSFVKAAVFTIMYNLKIKFDLKLPKNYNENLEVGFTEAIDSYLRELRSTIESRHACDYFDLFITITGIEGGGGHLTKNYRNLCFIQYCHRLLVMIS